MSKLLASTLWMERRSLRLDTLLRLRWLAAAGQGAVVIVVYWGFGYPLPIVWSLAAIGVAIWLTLALRLKYPNSHRLEHSEAATILAFDVVQLTLLLYLSGGLENPFALLVLAPVLISASALPPRTTIYLGALALVCALVVTFVHLPLPWDPAEPLRIPMLYLAGVWLAILLAMTFVGVYAWQVAEETRLLSDALTAAELVLAREQHLSMVSRPPPPTSSAPRSPPSCWWPRSWSASSIPVRRFSTTSACCASRRSAAARSSASCRSSPSRARCSPACRSRRWSRMWWRRTAPARRRSTW